jgi:hypothetical protein
MGFRLDPAARFDRLCEAGHTFDVLTPDREPIGATITVRGPESDAVRAHVRRLLARMQTREAKRRGGQPEPMTPEESDAEAVELAVAYTIGWQGFDDEAGDPLPFSEAAARTLYAGWPWIRRQVLDEAQDLGNFVRRGLPALSRTPAPSSAST